MNPNPYRREVRPDMAIVYKICDSIMDEGMGIAASAKKHGIDYRILSLWRTYDSEVEGHLQAAREARFDKLIEEIVDLAMNTPKDKEEISHTKMQIFAREKAAALLLPRLYKNTLDLTSNGKALEAPSLTINVDNRLQTLIQVALTRKEEAKRLTEIMDE